MACIYCWYADGFWWDAVGEWKPSQKRFPNGIKEVIDYIRSKGMIPGLWLELEVMQMYYMSKVIVKTLILLAVCMTLVISGAILSKKRQYYK